MAVPAAMFVENASPIAMVIARIKRRNDISGSSRPHRRIFVAGPVEATIGRRRPEVKEGLPYIELPFV